MFFSTLRNNWSPKNNFCNQDFPDLILVVPYKDEMIRIPVHRVILSSFSPLIKKLMLFQDNTETIVLEGTTRKEVENLIDHLYRGKDVIISRKLAIGLGVFEMNGQNEEIIKNEDINFVSNSIRKDVSEIDNDQIYNKNAIDQNVKKNAVYNDFYESIDYIKPILSETSTNKTATEVFNLCMKAEPKIMESTTDIFVGKQNGLLEGTGGSPTSNIIKDGEGESPIYNFIKDEHNKIYKDIHEKKIKPKANKYSFNLKGRSSMENLIKKFPDKFRLYNKYIQNCDSKKEMDKKSRSWEQFPCLIYEEELTKYVACLECAKVFLSIPSNHVCTISVDLLKGKQIEIVRNWTANVSSHLLDHFKQVNVDKIKCVHCDEKYDHMSNFKVHLKTDHNIETNLTKLAKMGLVGDYICDDCGRRFNLRTSLKQHEITEHNKTELGNFKCSSCQKVFVDKNLLDRHFEQLHTDIRTFICDACSKSFKKKDHLLNHKNVHSGERHWPCRHCDKTFAKDWTRKQHERLHLGLKPYKCQFCESSYSQKNSLDFHVKMYH